MVIYKATNKINGRMYIGQTVRPLKERIAEHLRCPKIPFSKAVAKYGAENFDFQIVDTANTIDELNEKEEYWINFYRTNVNGYNIRVGGGNRIGWHHTEEAKAKMSNLKKGRFTGAENPFYGKHHSEETKKRWSEVRSGRSLSEDWKEHISNGLCNRRKVRNIETGEVFGSVKEAASKYNIVATHITRVCRGRRKKTGGYHWEYADE